MRAARGSREPELPAFLMSTPSLVRTPTLGYSVPDNTAAKGGGLTADQLAVVQALISRALADFAEKIGADRILALICDLPVAIAVPLPGRACVIRTVAPVERFDHLLDLLLVAALFLPLLRHGHLEHALAGFAHAIERIPGVEVDGPPRLDM